MINSAEEFVALRTSDRQDEYLRAAHDSASDGVWLDVVARFPEMKVWVAHYKTVSSAILARLCGGPDPEVRSAVAMKNKLPEELFARLATDPSEGVRQRLVYNKNVPRTVLERLARDESDLVSVAARERLSNPNA